MVGNWAWRRQRVPHEPFKIPPSPAELRRLGLIPQHRGGRKKLRDQAHQSLYEEKRRIFHEAYKDVTNSPGEVVARTTSERLDIHPAEVLRDPKLRVPGGYQHPGLRLFFKIKPGELRERVEALEEKKNNQKGGGNGEGTG